MKHTFTFLVVALSGLSLSAQLTRETARLFGERSRHASVALSNGDVIVVGGTETMSFDPKAIRTCERYSKGQWMVQANMSVHRDEPALVRLPDGNLMVIGGEDNDEYLDGLKTCEIYDMNWSTWSMGPELNYARAGARWVYLDDGNILVIGGRQTGTCEIYDVNQKIWVETGSMERNRSTDFAAVKLKDGNVLVVGGNSETAELYDASTGTWSVLPNKPKKERDGCTGILLDDGRVLLAGEMFDKTTEVYDPADGSFTLTGELLQNVSFSEMIKLKDGRVLISGVGELFSEEMKVLQVFNPATNKWTSAGVPASEFIGTSKYTINRLNDNEILIAGGSDYGEVTQSCHIINESAIPPIGFEDVAPKVEAIYPSLTSDKLRIRVEQDFVGASFYITDISGRKVYSSTLEFVENSINVQDLSSGTYFVGFDGYSKAYKFVKQD